jgi:hypothetical protein
MENLTAKEILELEKKYKEKISEKRNKVVDFFRNELWSLLRVKYYKLYYSDYHKQKIRIVKKHLESLGESWKEIDKEFKESTGYYGN